MGQAAGRERQVAELVERLQPLDPVKIVVFGSVARGGADRWSDLDVIVVARRVAPRFLDRIAQAYELIDPRYALDILIYTPEEYAAMLAADNPLILTAQAEGQVVYAGPAA